MILYLDRRLSATESGWSKVTGNNYEKSIDHKFYRVIAGANDYSNRSQSVARVAGEGGRRITMLFTPGIIEYLFDTTRARLTWIGGKIQHKNLLSNHALWPCTPILRGITITAAALRQFSILPRSRSTLLNDFTATMPYATREKSRRLQTRRDPTRRRRAHREIRVAIHRSRACARWMIERGRIARRDTSN